MTRTDAFTVPGHVRGYPGVAFGGYVAGLLAAASGAPQVRVDFRRGVSVDTPVVLAADGSGGASLTDQDGAVLAEASAAMLTVTPRPAPPWAEALAATATADVLRKMSHCYGCGAACAPGRGLRLSPWAMSTHDMVVAAWTPDPLLGRPDGFLATENVWAALDCPGGWAAMALRDLRPGAVTAALTAAQFEPVRAGDPYLSYGWPISANGRKHTVGVALTRPDGTLCALAEALWIEPRQPLPFEW
ncbi:PaaI family thioesterase [Nocardia sp. NPDC057455]|uniref:PaaI family thioesterase n=1 Tax=Nocardia sp. NPDC057455 TaxID=3346138 RepID=UPI00366CCCB9